MLAGLDMGRLSAVCAYQDTCVRHAVRYGVTKDCNMFKRLEKRASIRMKSVYFVDGQWRPRRAYATRTSHHRKCSF